MTQPIPNHDAPASHRDTPSNPLLNDGAPSPPVLVHDIEECVAAYFGISTDVLRSSRRTQIASLARAVAMYLARELTGMSFLLIGQMMGDRSHSSVMGAIARFERALAVNAPLRWKVGDRAYEVPARHVLEELREQLARTVELATRRREERTARSLRQLVRCVPACAERFDQVEALALAILTPSSDRSPLPYFTAHAANHCRLVESYLDMLIFGGGLAAEQAFVPTPEEAMYLLSAAWLHDLWMVYGIFEGEKASDLSASSGIGKHHWDQHDLRTSRFILDRWKLNCDWERREQVYLANLCQYHRSIHTIQDFSPTEVDGRHVAAPVRLQLLAALVRLADACHVDASRAPGPLRALYDAVGMPAESVCHWEATDLITNVRFSHDDMTITFTAEIPPPFCFEVGVFDFSDLVQNVCQSVGRTLQGIRDVLAPYPNIGFTRVDSRVHRISALAFQSPRRCLAFWPYVLHQASRSSTDAAAATIQLIIFAARTRADFGASSNETVEAILAEALRSRPFDFLLRNLGHKVRAVLSEPASSPEGLTEKLVAELTTFLDAMKANTSAVVREASAVVDPNDVLFVYGYSTGIVGFLEHTRHSRSAPLYVVECSSSFDDPEATHEEDHRTSALVHSLGLDVRLVSLSGLASLLADFAARNVASKVLFGTRGVLPNGDLLCRPGTYSLALTARCFGARIVAFANREKVLRRNQASEDVTNAQGRVVETRARLRPPLDDVPWIVPTIDVVPCTLVDVVLGVSPIQSRADDAGSPSPNQADQR